MKTNKLKLITGILFGLLTIVTGFSAIMQIVNYGFYLESSISRLALVLTYLLITLGIFLDVKALRVIGSVIGVLASIYIFGYMLYVDVYQIMTIGYNIDTSLVVVIIVFVFETFVDLIYHVLLLIQNARKKTHACVTLGYMAGAIEILVPICLLFLILAYKYVYDWDVWVTSILYIVSPVFLGYFLYSDGVDDVLTEYAVEEAVEIEPVVETVIEEPITEVKVESEVAPMEVHVEEVKEEPAVTDTLEDIEVKEEIKTETPKKKVSSEQAIKELMKLKELYELRIITKEELEIKKKELL